MESQTDRKSLSHLMKDEAVHAKLCAVAPATPTQGHAVGSHGAATGRAECARPISARRGHRN